MHFVYSHSRGFSHLEIAVVLVIIASVLGSGSILTIRHFDQRVRGETDRKLNEIERMLDMNSIAKGRLPSLADLFGWKS